MSSFEDDQWFSSHEKKDDFLNKLDARKELQEETRYRKQCAIEKLKKMLESSIIDFYNTSDLDTIQRIVILQLAHRIYECEDRIPKEMWCKDCKSKELRILNLIKRFQGMQKKKKSKYYN
jgi:hypothetical protein